MSDTLYSYTYDGLTPIVYMGTGLVEVQRAAEHDPEDEAYPRPPDTAELRNGDVLVVSELLGLDVLHHLIPADQATADAMDALAHEGDAPVPSVDAPPLQAPPVQSPARSVPPVIPDTTEQSPETAITSQED